MDEKLKAFIKGQKELRDFFADKDLFNKAVKMTIEQRYGKDKVEEIFEMINKEN